MILKADKLHLKKLLSDAIPLLCKNGLPLHSMFRVEAMIGITVDDSEVALICFKETVTSDGELLPQVYGVDDDIEEVEECEEFGHLGAKDNAGGTAEKQNNSGSQSYPVRNSDNGSYGGVYDAEETYPSAAVKPENGNQLEVEMHGYDSADREVNSSSYLYEHRLLDGGGYDEHDGQVAMTSRSENQKSHAVRSDQLFIKEEVDLDIDDCMLIKEEHGLNPATYTGSYDFYHTSNDIPVKPRLGSRRGRLVYPNFSQQGEVTVPTSPAWPRKMKNFGPLRNRKVSGTVSSPGKASRNIAPLATMDIRTQGSAAGYSTMIQGLCDSILQQSTLNGDQFVCHICEAKLSNATTLRNHIRGTHLALKTERCNICGESFKWAMQLARHKKREHGDGSFIQIYNTVAGGPSESVVQDEY